MAVISWFYGGEIIIDTICLMVLASIIYYGIGYYRINRSQKKYLYLLFSFMLLGASYLLRIVAHLLVYAGQAKEVDLEFLTHIIQELAESGPLIFWLFIIHRMLSLLAFYFLFIVYSEKPSNSFIMLSTFLLVTIGYISHHQYLIYHITSFILILLIVIGMMTRYRERKSAVTKTLAYSFGFIMLSQFMFALLQFGVLYFIIAEFLQFIGYYLLANGFVRGIINAKKKGKA